MAYPPRGRISKFLNRKKKASVEKIISSTWVFLNCDEKSKISLPRKGKNA
jgi:hypothetical protein